MAVRISLGIRDLYHIHNVQTDFEGHPDPCAMATGGCSPGVKRSERATYNTPLSTAQVKNDRSYTSTHTCRHGKYRDLLFIPSKTILHINELLLIRLIQGVPGGMCQTSGGCSLC